MRLAVALVVMAFVGTAHAAAPSPIPRDLRLAAEYWRLENPRLTLPCAEQVAVGPMVTGQGNAGALESAAQAWAETEIGSCVIVLSPAAWTQALNRNQLQRFETCRTIAHEYGHSLGLPDSASLPMMNDSPDLNDDPICAQATYGHEHLSRHDRRWLASHLDAAAQ